MKDILSVLGQSLTGKGQVISISGPSASGKTTLALQLVSSLMTPESGDKSVWIQASETFPKKRLNSLIQKNMIQRKYILKNTFIIPSTHSCSSYEEFVELMVKIAIQVLPPNLKFIVIDNISHHLRFFLSKEGEIGIKSKIINNFFDKVLFPLIMRCKRDKIHLILIHEVSQDIETGRNRSFYFKLFNRIQSISINLEGSSRFQNLICEIDSNSHEKQIFSYQIQKSGIYLS